MTAKEKVRQLLERLPDDVTLEQIQYHLYVQQKIEHALASALEGELLSQEEVERHMTKWTTF
jgi:predicted transcriptional regulator